MHFFKIGDRLIEAPMTIGWEQQPNNFYLKGEVIDNRVVISGRFYGPEGEFLFELKNNLMSNNKKPEFNHIFFFNGFRIDDEVNRDVMVVETFRDDQGSKITYIYGMFFDNKGNLVAQGDINGLFINCPLKK